MFSLELANSIGASFLFTELWSSKQSSSSSSSNSFKALKPVLLGLLVVNLLLCEQVVEALRHLSTTAAASLHFVQDHVRWYLSDVSSLPLRILGGVLGTSALISLAITAGLALIAVRTCDAECRACLHINKLCLFQT
jgi:hypothetical protein